MHAALDGEQSVAGRLQRLHAYALDMELPLLCDVIVAGLEGLDYLHEKQNLLEELRLMEEDEDEEDIVEEGPRDGDAQNEKKAAADVELESCATMLNAKRQMQTQTWANERVWKEIEAKKKKKKKKKNEWSWELGVGGAHEVRGFAGVLGACIALIPRYVWTFRPGTIVMLAFAAKIGMPEFRGVILSLLFQFTLDAIVIPWHVFPWVQHPLRGRGDKNMEHEMNKAAYFNERLYKVSTFYVGIVVYMLRFPRIIDRMITAIVFEPRGVEGSAWLLTFIYTRIKCVWVDYVELDSTNVLNFASFSLFPGMWVIFCQRFAEKYGDKYYSGDQPFPTSTQCAVQVALWMGAHLGVSLSGNILACRIKGKPRHGAGAGAGAGASAGAAKKHPEEEEKQMKRTTKKTVMEVKASSETVMRVVMRTFLNYIFVVRPGTVIMAVNLCSWESYGLKFVLFTLAMFLLDAICIPGADFRPGGGGGGGGSGVVGGDGERERERSGGEGVVQNHNRVAAYSFLTRLYKEASLRASIVLYAHYHHKFTRQVLKSMVYEPRSNEAYLLTLTFIYTRLVSHYQDCVDLQSCNKNAVRFASFTVALIPGAFVYYWQRFAEKYGDEYYSGDHPLPTSTQCAVQVAWMMGTQLLVASLGNSLGLSVRAGRESARCRTEKKLE